MKDLSQKLIVILKKLLPAGSVVELIKMEGEDSVKPGAIGTILFVDDIGQIHVQWDNGSQLALVYGVDQFSLIPKTMD